MLLLVPEFFSGTEQDRQSAQRLCHRCLRVLLRRGLALCRALAFLCELALLNLVLQTLHVGSVRKKIIFCFIFISYAIDRGGNGDLVCSRTRDPGADVRRLKLGLRLPCGFCGPEYLSC